MTAYYIADPHTSQFDGSIYAGENCTPTTGANGAKTVSAGRISKTGGEIRLLVHRWEETDPATPGWSIPDLALAMFRIGVGFNEGVSGSGWASALSWLSKGYYLAVQGDSDQFANNTCSGAFNGNHCIGINPRVRNLPNGENDHWIDDPICPGGRWENTSTLHEYAAKLDSNIRFGVFTQRVPPVSSTLWGPDVNADIRSADPSGQRTANIFKKIHHGFGTVINMPDILLLFHHYRLSYGSVVERLDMLNLFKHAGV